METNANEADQNDVEKEKIEEGANNVLVEGKINHQVNQIALPKNLIMVEPDGYEVNVSRWSKPLNERK